MNRNSVVHTVGQEKTTEELWADLRSGDKYALELLYKQYSQALFQLGISLSGDPDFVQDCIQEIFIDLWKYRGTIKQTDNVKLYLFKMLSNKMNTERQKEGRRVFRQRTAALQWPSYLESIETELTLLQRDELLRKKLSAALKKLPLRQNEVIQYLFFENLSYEDTAKLMDINLRSVYTLAWKALSSLKKAVYTFSILAFFCGH